MDDYAGTFDPSVDLTRFSRRGLATLGREYMLFGHLLNRAGLPPVHMALGPAARETIAIEEWMAASPIYTPRMRRAMEIQGNDVETIFKGLQIDVGFAHQYMDVHYELESPERGYFWLQSCGALLELEPHGEAAVFSMCHNIEDPTFDATAVATNPRARCRPVHRPPRVPADRVPHCRWECVIDPTAEPVQEIPLTDRVRASKLASIAFAEPVETADGGRPDYRGAFDPDFQLEALSRAALIRACRELLMQDQLLIRALMKTVAERASEETAAQVGTAQWIGSGAVASTRLRSALGIVGDDAEAILKVLQLHPAFLPGYTDVRFALESPRQGRFWFEPCAALEEQDRHSWFGLLGGGATPGFDAMVQAVNPRARCVPAGRLAWDVVIDPAAEPAPEPAPAAMVRASRAARFAFTPRPLAA